MSVKHPKFRMALKLVLTVMLGFVIHNSVQDYERSQGEVRRLSALNEFKAIHIAQPSNDPMQVAKR